LTFTQRRLKTTPVNQGDLLAQTPAISRRPGVDWVPLLFLDNIAED